MKICLLENTGLYEIRYEFYYAQNGRFYTAKTDWHKIYMKE